MKFLRENVGREQPVGGNSDDARDHEGVPEPLNHLHERVVAGEIQGKGGLLPLERKEGPGQVRRPHHGVAGRLSVIVPRTWGRCGIVQQYQTLG